MPTDPSIIDDEERCQGLIDGAIELMKTDKFKTICLIDSLPELSFQDMRQLKSLYMEKYLVPSVIE